MKPSLQSIHFALLGLSVASSCYLVLDSINRAAPTVAEKQADPESAMRKALIDQKSRLERLEAQERGRSVRIFPTPQEFMDQAVSCVLLGGTFRINVALDDQRKVASVSCEAQP